MASNTAAVNIGGVITAAGTRNSGMTTATVQAGGVLAATRWQFGNGTIQKLAASAASWLPAPRVPVTDANGVMTTPWYKFFDAVAKQLGGPNAPSVTDVNNNLSTVNNNIVTTQNNIQLVADATNATIAATNITTTVAQNASLPGSAAIPVVKPITINPNNPKTASD